MIIKKFESHDISESDIWCVNFVDEDWRGSPKLRIIGCYTTEMLAADKLIKYVNDRWDKSFEPFFEDDNRLFSSIEENEDYDKCLEYCKENDIEVFCNQSVLYKNSLKS